MNSILNTRSNLYNNYNIINSFKNINNFYNRFLKINFLLNLKILNNLYKHYYIYYNYNNINIYILQNKILIKEPILSNDLYINLLYNINFNFYTIKNIYLSITSIIEFIKINLLLKKSIKIIFNSIYYNLLQYENFSGVKLIINGRINKLSRAFSTNFIKGKLSLESLHNYFNYKELHLKTKYGMLGIKLWISYKKNYV